MAELYGKGTGLVKGKGGSMHLFDVENGLMGGYGIVGGHIPLGVGMAYALRYQGTDGIVQLYLGDGAIHNGAFHEAANLAGLWGRDGMNPTASSSSRTTTTAWAPASSGPPPMTDLGSKFDSYGIPHEKVDGMDLDAVMGRAHRAANRVRETGKPYAIEAMTYRIAPHGAADFLERYRTKDEVKEAAQARPDRPLRAQAARERRGHRGAARGDPGRRTGEGRRGGQVRRREPGAGSGRALHGRLCIRNCVIGAHMTGTSACPSRKDLRPDGR